MITNELIFLGYILTVSTACLLALRLGKEYLMGLISAMAVLVNLFTRKQIILLGFTATASDALAVGITLGLNLLQEYYGKEQAIKALWIGFFCALFYSVMSLLHLAYLPAPGDISDPMYRELFESMPRTVIASLVSFLVVQFTDTQLYGFLKWAFEGNYFVLRNYASLAVTQLLDTVLFTFLGLWGISESFSDLNTIIDIIIISYMIKVAVIIIAVPYVRLAKKLQTPINA
jgi:queuosine precursor transporter